MLALPVVTIIVTLGAGVHVISPVVTLGDDAAVAVSVVVGGGALVACV